MSNHAIARFLKNYEMNFIIKILIVSDFLIWSANQLFVPVFAIFILDRIEGGNIEVVGISTAIYFASKAFFEIPIGMYIDKTKSEKDNYYATVIGSFGLAIALVMYAHITQVWELYIVQAVFGILAALALPGWYSIFIRHVDTNREAFEWCLYDVLMGIGMAIAAAFGGVIVLKFGFNALLYISATGTFTGAFLLLLVKDQFDK